MPTIAPSPTVAALAELEALAKSLKSARDVVAERVRALDDEVQDAYRRKLPGIQSALADAKAAKDALLAVVNAHPDLFVKPRSMTLHQITLGLKKGVGKMDWDCEDENLVTRIEKRFKDDAALLGVLINTKKTPAKEGLKALDAKDLAALGIEIEATGDFAFAKAVDSSVDKLVKRVLEAGPEAAT